MRVEGKNPGIHANPFLVYYQAIYLFRHPLDSSINNTFFRGKFHQVQGNFIFTDKDSAQWIKASVENKITSKNTWNSNLIDVFSDVENLREKSITNFQHASLLLDGSVKVYSTRVDNFADEAEKLMECVEESRPAARQRGTSDRRAPREH